MRGSWMSRQRLTRVGLVWFAGMLGLLARPAAAQVGEAPVRDPRHFFQKKTMHWLALRNRHVVMQQRDYSCGAAALATLLRYYWQDPTSENHVLRTVERQLTAAEMQDRVLNGLSLADLRKTAVKLGYTATAGHVTLEQLAGVKVPVIVAIRHQDYDHFVVIRGFVNGWVYLADPIRGNVRLPETVFAGQWIDRALLVVLRPDQTQSAVSQLAVTADEVDAGWLNDQVVRTHPQRVFPAR